MTQSVGKTLTGLVLVRQSAKRNPKQRFNNLLKHLTPELLRQAYYALNTKAAKGVDDVSWEDYGQELDAHITDLCTQVHTNRYKPQPVKRIWIPKADGQQRPIGITTIEDKVVQQAVVWVLEAIYEVDFLGFSYGFRPGRSQHHALDAVYVAIASRKVSWVLDADIKRFFDTLQHDWMMMFLEHRIADPRLLRIVERTLKCGVVDEGRKTKTEAGTPQGAVLSPLLANIYLHYALDLWVRQWRYRHSRGAMYAVRYADDSLYCFQYLDDGKRFQRALEQRLSKFGLSLNPEKTRLVEFGRFAKSNRRERGLGKPDTFDFLGFTHFCSVRWSTGEFALRRITVAKRQRAKIAAIKKQLKRNLHRPVVEVGQWLRKVVTGYLNYYAVPGNLVAMTAFRTEVCKAWFKALRRRSQKGGCLPWYKFQKLVRLFMPSVRVVHPYPVYRFGG